MTENLTFNLTSDPWIKVLDKQTGTTKTVSLTDLFANAQNYRRLAGDTRSQDFAILRFLLAIVHTVYSRVGLSGEAYSWLEVDSDTFQVLNTEDAEDGSIEEWLQTWNDLYVNGQFSSAIVRYLEGNSALFDLFGPHPFYQVTTEDYDSFVPEKKKVATGTGTVAVKQINRVVSESANSPAIFAPKAGSFKNRLTLAEITRWLITYQNYTGVTDKTKIDTAEKFSTPGGWAYRLNSVYAPGQSLFETLMLNFVVNPERKNETPIQRPTWEYNNISDYVELRKSLLQPTNLAALYTTWSRLLHIEWQENGQPTIFSAGIPMFSQDNLFLEPMTTWREDKQAKDGSKKPATKGTGSLGIAMWRNFGDYVSDKTAKESHEPGIVQWLDQLVEEELIDGDKTIYLNSIALVSDGNATSQSPVAEVFDYMGLNADVLFDDKEELRWPNRINGVIDTTQKVARQYWQFTTRIADIRNLDSRSFSSRETGKFYDRLNEPFKQWLVSLKNNDDREVKIEEWYRELRDVVNQSVDVFERSSTPRDHHGKSLKKNADDREKPMNIFIAENNLRAQVNSILFG